MKRSRKIIKPVGQREVTTASDSNRYPKGWNRQRVESVISHYENQSDEQAVAEDAAAYRATTSTMMQVPLALVPKVEKMIARAG